MKFLAYRKKFWRYVDEGLDAKTLRQLHATMVKLHIEWVVALGQTRWHFMFITALGLPITVLCYWVGYMTDFTHQDTSGWPLISVIIWSTLAELAKATPVVYPLHLIVSLVTGAFFREFWCCVERLKVER